MARLTLFGYSLEENRAIIGYELENSHRYERTRIHRDAA
jgi:hypothetical protein